MKTIKLSTLKLNDRNPRTIQTDAFDRLCKSIERDPEFMTLRPIVCDKERIVIGGNQRYRACQKLGMQEVPETWVRIADLTDEQRKRFILVDNAPDGMAGEWDWDILTADWSLKELTILGFGSLLQGIEDINEEDSEKYTTKIIPPVYAPKGECPRIEDLADRTKTEELQSEIEQAELPEDVARFMKLASERHTIFNFRQIAEFYCHADAKLQDLMEKNGLVIIDFKKAIELGFVHLSDRLAELADLESEGDEDA